ncbi:transposase [Chryseobacterium oranimense]|uniref:transposase n=1 Tax=Chryseobacterium oranimense TaxID=421058 RepID=UPI0031E0D3B6
MGSHFKDIHLGALIKEKVIELEIETSRICNFLKCREEEVKEMYLQKDLQTNIVLKWSKLLEYDFFRIYSQHLILFAPTKTRYNNSQSDTKKSNLPQFRKNIYTRDIIDFILEQINSGEKTRQQVIDEYRIPKTTLYKWIVKDNKKNN